MDRPCESRFDRADYILCLLLALAAVAVLGRDISVGGFRFPDTSVHAMDGVLIHDWLAAGPRAWLNPKEFALQQYAHHPSLGMVGVYPPGFAIFEALFFAIFGISIFTARLSVLAFGLAAIAGTYRLGWRLGGRATGVLGAAALLSIPGVVTWSRQVMLEMPTLAVLIWTAIAVEAYFRRPTWLKLSGVCALAIAGPVFKQNAIFMIPLLGLTATYLLARRRMPWKHYLTALALIGLPVGIYYVWAIVGVGAGSHIKVIVTEDRSLDDFQIWPQIEFYLRGFREAVGWPIAALALIGLPVSLRRRDWRWLLILGWFVLFMGMTLFLQFTSMETRYFYFGHLPLALWAGAGAAMLARAIRPVVIARTITAVAALAAVVMGYRAPLDLRPDYDAVIGAYAERMRHRLVLFEGRQDGGFNFAARRQLGSQQCAVVRGSKLFYTCFSMPKYGFESRAASHADVAAVLEKYGFDLILIERENLDELQEIELLREELRDSGKYELLGSHALNVTEDPGNRHAIEIDVYRPRYSMTRRAREIEIPVPMIGQNLRVRLDGWDAK